MDWECRTLYGLEVGVGGGLPATSGRAIVVNRRKAVEEGGERVCRRIGCNRDDDRPMETAGVR